MQDTVAETIASVTSQKRLGDQYILIDGASTDGTLAIAQRFHKSIDLLVSEPDAGQYHAIAKGFSHATGDIMAWINGDDILMPWTFNVVSDIFARFPDVHWITGAPSMLSEKSHLTRIELKMPAYPRSFIANGWFRPGLGEYLQQESMFWRRSLWDKVGGLDLSLKLAGDFDLWMRFAEHTDLIPANITLGAFRHRPGLQRSSLNKDEYEAEVEALCTTRKPPPAYWRFISSRGRLGKHIARSVISAKQPAIIYNFHIQQWDMTTRRRTIARQTWSELLDTQILRWKTAS
jgi:glycosyltransferase involved in cell wall biosynthesis